MTKTTLVSLLLPFLVFTQQSEGHFDISKEEFFYDKMNTWKTKIFNDEIAEYKTLADNDSILTFSVQGEFTAEMFQLSLDSKNRINKIEHFFYALDGDLDFYFPHRYPVNISEIFKSLGQPILTKSNQAFIPTGKILDSDYGFSKYYKWTNASSYETNIILEVATIQVKKSITNKSGKVKNHVFKDCGYVAETAITPGKTSEKDIKFTMLSKFANGAIKAWKVDKPELINILGPERFKTSDSWFDEEILPYSFFIKDIDNPKEFLKIFLINANTLYNIDFDKQFLEQNQKFTYTALSGNTIAQALGMDKSCCVEILIDTDNWNRSGLLEKLFIMFHEFGHDIYNLSHSDGIRLMATNEFKIENPEMLGEMYHEMMFQVLLKQVKSKK